MDESLLAFTSFSYSNGISVAADGLTGQDRRKADPLQVLQPGSILPLLGSDAEFALKPVRISHDHYDKIERMTARRLADDRQCRHQAAIILLFYL